LKQLADEARFLHGDRIKFVTGQPFLNKV
jgi:hypothetical protein